MPRILALILSFVLAFSTAPASADPALEALVAAMNSERASKRLAPLVVNAKLNAAAQAHADDLAKKGYFSHKGKNGSTPSKRVKRKGYRACLTAENLSKGYPSPERAVHGWMNSDGHRRNILLRDAREIGVGIGAGAIYVAVFATPC